MAGSGLDPSALSVSEARHNVGAERRHTPEMRREASLRQICADSDRRLQGARSICPALTVAPGAGLFLSARHTLLRERPRWLPRWAACRVRDTVHACRMRNELHTGRRTSHVHCKRLRGPVAGRSEAAAPASGPGIPTAIDALHALAAFLKPAHRSNRDYGHACVAGDG